VLIGHTFNTVDDQILDPAAATSLAAAIRNVLAPEEPWAGVHNPNNIRKGKFIYARAHGTDAERAMGAYSNGSEENFGNSGFTALTA